uniref:F-box/LRR-repeat protein 17-like isoform X2 n=1 Tax=Myxine glutinosa TaxID=7769 RepID=UPI00358FC92A
MTPGHPVTFHFCVSSTLTMALSRRKRQPVMLLGESVQVPCPPSKQPCLEDPPLERAEEGPLCNSQHRNGKLTLTKVEYGGSAQPADITNLPDSIVLKVLSYLSLSDRCHSAALVCHAWHDLCFDPQLWRRIDLSTQQQVTDEVLLKLVSRSRSVAAVVLTDCRGVSDNGIAEMAACCPRLIELVATRCKQLGDRAVAALGHSCFMLSRLHLGNLDRLTDVGLIEIARGCPMLKDVHLGQCYRMSDSGLVPLARACTHLERIYLQENEQVTDVSVEALAVSCPYLRSVGLMGCSVTSRGISRLAKLEHLENLDLRHVAEVGGDAVVNIVKKCCGLVTLNLCLNRAIDDKCVEVVAKEGRNLQELYLVSCSITDRALMAIGQYSHSIKTVDVGWCQEITDDGATEISRACHSLTYLGLMRCDKVLDATVEKLAARYPTVTYSTMLQDCKRTLEWAHRLGWRPAVVLPGAFSGPRNGSIQPLEVGRAFDSASVPLDDRLSLPDNRQAGGDATHHDVADPLPFGDGANAPSALPTNHNDIPSP